MKSKTEGDLCALISTFIISSSFIFIEELKNVANPLFIVFYRFLCSSVILLLLVFVFYRKDLVNLKKLFLKTGIVGFFYASYFVLQIYAQQHTTVLNVSSIHTLVPFLTYLATLLYQRERINIKKLAVFAFAMLSTLWVVFRGDVSAFLSLKLNVGDLIYLLAAICLVFYVISMKLIYKGERAIVLVFGSLLNGLLFLTVFMLLFGFTFEFNQIDTAFFWSIAYLVVFSTVITMFLFQKATVSIGAVSVSSYTYLTPSMVLLFSWFLYGQIPEWSVVVAVLCSCLATLFIQTRFFQGAESERHRH